MVRRMQNVDNIDDLYGKARLRGLNPDDGRQMFHRR